MRATALLSLMSIELLECALQFFKLLSRVGELAFRGEALVVGEVFGSFRDECVEVGCGLRQSGGCRCVLRRHRSAWRGAQRRGRSTKKGRHRRLEGWSVRKPILHREYDQTQLRHRTPLGLQVNRFPVQQCPSTWNYHQRTA